MSTMTQTSIGGHAGAPDRPTVNMPSLVLRLGVLFVIDAITIWLVYQFLDDGILALAVVLAAITIWLNVIFLNEQYYPMRWLAPGMSLLILMVVYPVFFTIGVSFTNYGTGHLVTKQIAIDQLEARVYLPQDAAVYRMGRAAEHSGRVHAVADKPGNRRDLHGRAGGGARRTGGRAARRGGRLHADSHGPDLAHLGALSAPGLWPAARPRLPRQPTANGRRRPV